jgi:hypothetical protein
LYEDLKKNAIHLDEKSDPGVAWLENILFGNGIIEFDAQGKDVLQHSFIGIAFHGLNDTTYDAVYFRPFNFKSPDAVRRSHSVQYISHPAFDWEKLRTEFPNQYEQAVSPAPDAAEWFHVRVVISNPKVTVYVNDNKQPVLVIDQLSDRKRGKIGFWVGNQSDGNFANIKITSFE